MIAAPLPKGWRYVLGEVDHKIGRADPFAKFRIDPVGGVGVSALRAGAVIARTEGLGKAVDRLRRRSSPEAKRKGASAGRALVSMVNELRSQAIRAGVKMSAHGRGAAMLDCPDRTNRGRVENRVVFLKPGQKPAQCLDDAEGLSQNRRAGLVFDLLPNLETAAPIVAIPT